MTVTATRKRFYKNTGIVQNDSKWEVTLDHRRLKTPNGQVLLVPSEPLARAIAAEWDSQTEIISLPTMHLVTRYADFCITITLQGGFLLTQS